MECRKYEIKFSIPAPVAGVIEKLRRAGFEAFIAGGAVRDMLLGGYEVKDFDVATSARPQDILSLFPSAVFIDPSSSFPVVRLRVGEYEVDIATFRGEVARGRHDVQWRFADTMFEDASRRDFTINALYYDLTELIDCFGGLEDMAYRRIRFVGNPEARIREDELRMLRALRFAVRLGFNIDVTTLSAIRRSAELIREVPRERIWEEIFRATTTQRFSYFVGLLHRTYLLPYIMPHISMLHSIPPPPAGEHVNETDMLMHTLRVLARLDVLKAPPEVKLAGLYHDAGYIYTVHARGRRASHPGHEEASARIAEEELAALRAPRRVIRLVTFLVRHHMRLHHVYQSYASGAGRRSIVRAVARFAFDVHMATRQFGMPPQQLAEYVAMLYIADFGASEIAELFKRITSLPLPRINFDAILPSQRVNALRSAFVQHALRSL